MDFARLLPRSRQELIQCRNDLLTFIAQRFYKIAELIHWYRDYLERMQHDRRSPYFESGVEAGVTYLSNRRFSHQWNDDSASVFVKL